eukprot:TRINITY_DN7925_c0_g1_i15.p1 TRINITY_DN7925_c0_g1~~TRINITY_DN7925_c0_g1_i15.p1  ORF type:complete len:282 (+),score=30.55 TRINITY_DN7925_c0_g1_i15:394-1239(+)
MWPIGIALLVYAPERVTKTCLGIFFFFFALWRLYDMYVEFHQLKDKLDQVEIQEHPSKENDSYQGTSHVQINAEKTDSRYFPLNDGNIQVASPSSGAGNSNPSDDTALLKSGDSPEEVWQSTILSRKQLFYSFLVSLVAGLLGGLYGVYGPPFMALFSMLPLTKHETRATANVCVVLFLPFRFYLMIKNDLIQLDGWLLYIFVVCATLFGMGVGHMLMTKVNTKIVLLVILSLLVVSSVSLVDMGSKLADTCVLIVIAFIVAVSWLLTFRQCIRVFGANTT